MNFEDPHQLCLAGSLLLADPSLQDQNFCRAVIYLDGHSAAEGAHGFVLNRPLDKTVGEYLDPDEIGRLAEAPVFVGGPVEPGQLIFASLHWDEDLEQFQFASHLSPERAQEAIHAGHLVHAYLGYSGWTGGQIEAELMQRAWIPAPPSPDLLDLPHTDALWGGLLRSMGLWYQLLADMPPNPSLN